MRPLGFIQAQESLSVAREDALRPIQSCCSTDLQGHPRSI